MPRWLLLLLVGAPSGAQEVPVVTLSRTDAELGEPFSQIDGVRELRDGRVIVLDTRDRVVQLVDLTRGTLAPIGRHGAGPGEYRSPLRLFGFAGDTSAIYDSGNSRLMLILPDGRPGATTALVPTARKMGSVAVSSRYVPAQSDSEGRLYRLDGWLVLGPGGPKRADTAAIQRWDRQRDRFDVVAHIRMRFVRMRTEVNAPGMEALGPAVPFTNGDTWAVAADGRVAIVRYDPYRVEYVTPTGARITGPLLPWDPISVSEEHKQEWLHEQLRSMRGASGPAAETPDADEWPEHLPPFLAAAASFAPDGMLWVKRTTVAGGPPTYDVIDPAGRLVRQVVLPARSRLVGFGNRSVYVSRFDQDDLQYLRRYALPRS